ncbi:S9 family peptidase [Sediminibacterium goheungense]|uniref:Prolyl oligopeptidase family protein n=1 Tax=Sediminibacterium goheungense TaxID=1086393 RepID=A0A4R6IYX8_9BACT|nr:prolyl oligopeptidase family serine peptidase [Sediminibacterium goheungense]TDO28074.1 prolyl oligopeptidase family protein [Sediminibacterium goheungense]
MKKLMLALLLLPAIQTLAQKKPLDHTVYDGWESLGERVISNNGKYVAYAVNPQEGDGNLYIQSVTGDYKVIIPRGYNVSITEDNQYAICRIRAFFKDTREARIKKRRPDEMPKDSLAIVALGKTDIVKVPRIKSYKVPDQKGTWLAYLLDKPLPETNRPRTPDSLTRINTMLSMADSLIRVADSIRNKANLAKSNGLAVLQPARTNRSAARPAAEPVEEGTELVLKNLLTGEERRFALVKDYYFNKAGTVLLIETTRKNSDEASVATIIKLNLEKNTSAAIFKRFNEAKAYRMDEAGTQVAFVAERDSSSKALQKFFKLYYHKDGMDSASLLADNKTKGVPANWTISDNPGSLVFSKSGNKLFLGTLPIWPVRDTTVPEIDRVSVDVWHYNDDYIQPVQLRNMNNELRRNYTAYYDMAAGQVVQLANEKLRTVVPTQEGDGNVFYGVSDYGKRIATQWQGFSLNDVYKINPATGAAEVIRKDLKGGNLQPSYTGKYLLFFDEIKQQYFVYNNTTQQLYQVAKDIKTSLGDEENDVPDDPNAYGIVKWSEGDQYVYVYDRYDIWQVDPEGKAASVCLTAGRKDKTTYRYVNTDQEERFIKAGKTLLLRAFDERDKSAGLATLNLFNKEFKIIFKEKMSVSPAVQKAKDADVVVYSKETYQQSPNVYVQALDGTARQLSNTNPQQSSYNWGTAELFKWKAYTGKEAEGIVYKPEDFDPKKKYPMIVYFYERSSDGLYGYNAPAPTPSRLNISFFVSRGYVVFVPDIWYKKGYPGQGAYDYILSGTRAVVKQGYVDSTRLGLQGQSWGGYQIAHLITRTNLYAAAWAGAPVVNMTSAYGGIRWGTGLTRQFQYEKTQSRIGATLWEKPNLYIENSPLFHLPKVTTPLVIMSNDADDAVPWYQGIEYYTAMRRLGKKVWLLNYNNEAHNLVERKNRKDIQIREQQFFDYLLKGEKPAKWITEGIPATMKGKEMGLDIK